ncbi:MAG: hypothetical protein A3F67_09200 [Verrucomicrobia bacterium RIFCSPHIGHO2_12_FULL_41_10]|nr:MAG: hypothetical protein A3F67_09200 [Verrucomicrobia bacterium RIFCSPHIGHO2_12_FULL_41_10]HLB34209.1 hypothetical protein [Chthoniobacterales bacterium]
MSNPLKSLTSNLKFPVSHLIIGVGNAGVNVLDRLLVSAPSFSGLLAINNDAEALAASVVTKQIALSDAEEAAVLMEELAPRLAEVLAAASIVILCGGLGGRTTSTLLPQIAEISKASKKLTLACVSYPFSFEGKRVQSTASEALSALEEKCDGVILFDNNSLGSATASTASLGETFEFSDEAMQVALPALLAMLSSKGPVRITRSDLLAALSRSGAKIHFGHGQATGPNRLHEALERAFKSPLLDRGRSLAKAHAIFILLRGPKNLSFAEAQAAMQEVERVAGEAGEIQLGVHAEESDDAPLQVFILATLGGSTKKARQQAKPSSVQSSSVRPNEVTSELSFEKSPMKDELSVAFSEEINQPDLDQTIENPKPAVAKPKQTQGALNLTTAQRGRFDKSEPTIVEGEDLDIPTYLRLGLKLTLS